MDDLISRQAAIDALHMHLMYRMGTDSNKKRLDDWINGVPSAQPEPHWIPCSERLPEEDHWLGGSGRQFSDEVLVSVVNYDDEDTWVYISQTIDGKWALELPRHCEITAWRPLPEPYRGGDTE